MSPTVTANLAARSYPICIGRGVLSGTGQDGFIPEKGARCLIVSDSNVEPLYGKACREHLERLGCRTRTAVIPAGEASKTAQTLLSLYPEALAAGLDRKGWVVALGGGVVGDLAGYLAGTWLRGIRFLQIPTSLLAMVDSSVGGKTGVNLPEGKNLVGVFHQPSAVWIDLDCLVTLPERERQSGFSEIVKTASIADVEFFRMLEDSSGALQDPRSEVWTEWVTRSCRIKADIVSADEQEAGRRALLNFGHTLGHALEAVSGYGRWSHGEAVAMGMIFSARLSQRVLEFPAEELDRLMALLLREGLPVRAPDGEWAVIRKAMALDKKSISGVPQFVLLARIGDARPGHRIPDAMLEEVWHACCQ
jgi:3-dehydroquinate synthase